MCVSFFFATSFSGRHSFGSSADALASALADANAANGGCGAACAAQRQRVASGWRGAGRSSGSVSMQRSGALRLAP